MPTKLFSRTGKNACKAALAIFGGSPAPKIMSRIGSRMIFGIE